MAASFYEPCRRREGGGGVGGPRRRPAAPLSGAHQHQDQARIHVQGTASFINIYRFPVNTGKR